LGSLRKKNLSEDLGRHARIIFKWFLQQYSGRVRIGLKWLRIWSGGWLS
jgi:hypothetical protein